MKFMLILYVCALIAAGTIVADPRDCASGTCYDATQHACITCAPAVVVQRGGR